MTLKRIFTSLLIAIIAATAIMAAAATKSNDVRALWLTPGATPEAISETIDKAVRNGYTTVLMRVETPSGVMWESLYAPASATLAYSKSVDILTEPVYEALARGLEVMAVVRPDTSLDDSELVELYREMLLRYPFSGVMIDYSSLYDLTDSVRIELIDRLTLELITEFDGLTTAIAVTPDREGDMATEALRLTRSEIVDNVYLTTTAGLPYDMLTKQWDANTGVIATYADTASADDASYRRHPWGVAFNTVEDLYPLENPVDEMSSRAAIADEPARADVEISCTNAIITLKSRGSLIGTVNLYNLSGEEVRSRRYNRHNATMNVADLSTGIYVVMTIDKDGRRCSKKILVK